MKKTLLAAACLMALAPFANLPAAAQSDPAQVGVVTAPPWNQTGKDFVQFMMMGDKFEIAAGRLALERSSNSGVRDFARNMINAHEQMDADLKEVSDHTIVNRYVTPPPAFDPRHQQMYTALESSFGPDFDRLYVNQQFDGHREALAYVEGYARHGGVPDLQRFARSTVPIIRDHLAMLRALRGEGVAMNMPSDTTVIAAPEGTTTVIETE